MKKALFLDRDGVINIEKNYLYKITDFEFIEGVFSSCKYFQDKGYLLIVITNQAGIARGKYTDNDFECLNEWMLEQFANHGVMITKVYYCPHHPEYTAICACRKPSPGMIIQAQKEFDLDLSKSLLVGDKEGDIQAGLNAQIEHNILVRSGHRIDETSTAARVIIDSIADLPEVYKVP